MLQQIIGGMVLGVDQLIVLFLLLGWVDAGLISPSLTTSVSSPALPRQVHLMQPGARGGAGETFIFK